jgi:hypothetical protein
MYWSALNRESFDKGSRVIYLLCHERQLELLLPMLLMVRYTY